jgi:hypothetical protein
MPDEKQNLKPAEPISIVPKSVPATTAKQQPQLPPHIPQFAPVKHPLRFGVHGKKHLIAPLKELIAADASIPAHYKDLIYAELDSMKSNAAEVSLHVTDNPDGSVSFSGHIKPIQLG